MPLCMFMARRGCMRMYATVGVHVQGDVGMHGRLRTPALGARLSLWLTTLTIERCLHARICKWMRANGSAYYNAACDSSFRFWTWPQ